MYKRQGLNLAIEVIVDGSINARVAERTVEEHDDADALTGTALLARELGAQVIKEFEK